MGRVRQLGIQAAIFLLTIGLVIGCVGVVGGAAVAIFSAYRSHIERWEISRAHQEFARAINERALDDLRLAEVIARLPAVRAALASDDRDRLLAELEGAYATLAPRQIDRMHFYRADGTTFARVHRPADVSDDGRLAQEVVYRTNRDHVARRGIDLGPNGVRVRGVVPISDGAGRHLGVLDISTYVTPEFMRQIETGEALYRVFLLGRGGYRLAVESGTSPAPLLSQDALALTNRGLDVAFLVDARDAQFLTTAIPLLDYDKDNVGAVQIDIDMSQVETRYRELILVLVIGSLLLLVAGAGWGAMALRSITGPVETLIRTTDKIAAGGAREPVPLQERNDTVGRFARALEQLRAS
ncbi:MAG TPA: cache domain-containing protein, partial [Alphaproteobacteria bacterium]